MKSLKKKKQRLREEYKGICALCQEPVKELQQGSVDHIIPISKGGSNRRSNLQYTHRRCNTFKGNEIYLYKRFVKPPSKKQLREKKRHHSGVAQFASIQFDFMLGYSYIGL